MEVTKNETSFKIELICIVLLWVGIALAPLELLPLIYKLILGFSLMLVLIAEMINSAIERVVDLVTMKHHPLAKHAKDAGSAIVFMSICTVVGIWLSVGWLLAMA